MKKESQPIEQEEELNIIMKNGYLFVLKEMLILMLKLCVNKWDIMEEENFIKMDKLEHVEVLKVRTIVENQIISQMLLLINVMDQKRKLMNVLFKKKLKVAQSTMLLQLFVMVTMEILQVTVNWMVLNQFYHLLLVNFHLLQLSEQHVIQKEMKKFFKEDLMVPFLLLVVQKIVNTQRKMSMEHLFIQKNLQFVKLLFIQELFKIWEDWLNILSYLKFKIMIQLLEEE